MGKKEIRPDYTHSFSGWSQCTATPSVPKWHRLRKSRKRWIFQPTQNNNTSCQRPPSSNANNFGRGLAIKTTAKSQHVTPLTKESVLQKKKNKTKNKHTFFTADNGQQLGISDIRKGSAKNPSIKDNTMCRRSVFGGLLFEKSIHDGSAPLLFFSHCSHDCVLCI